MKITRSNYESWFLDFLEGNLDPSMMDEFQAFLKQNPDLAAELKIGDLIIPLTNNTTCFGSKEQLKKSVNAKDIEFQELVVAYHEGDLSLTERMNFEAWLSENPDSVVETEQFRKLKLVADKSVIYENTEQLKRRGTILPLWIKLATVAALLVLAYLLFQPQSGVRSEFGKQVADLKSQEPKNVAAPEAKVKVEEKTKKNTKSVDHKKAPDEAKIKQKLNPAGEKSEKKVELTPRQRVTDPDPSLLKPRGVYFGQPVEIELAVMTLKDSSQASEEYVLSELLKKQLAAMRKSGDREILSTDHLGLAGLQLFAKLTGKRLTVRTGGDGVVRSVSFNSRLLALSIPVNR